MDDSHSGSGPPRDPVGIGVRRRMAGCYRQVDALCSGLNRGLAAVALALALAVAVGSIPRIPEMLASLPEPVQSAIGLLSANMGGDVPVLWGP